MAAMNPSINLSFRSALSIAYGVRVCLGEMVGRACKSREATPKDAASKARTWRLRRQACLRRLPTEGMAAFALAPEGLLGS
jgi:hypothetical protein